jgi:CheY-like chemotaxis protein
VRSLAKLLELSNHVVTTAGSAGDAMQAVERQTFDVMISDLGLPDGSGYDVMRFVRDRQPIFGIAISGFGMEEDLQRSRDAGFSEHLTKPIEFRKLLEVLQRLGQPSQFARQA